MDRLHFAVNLPVEYSIIRRRKVFLRGFGETVRMGSRKIQFSTDRPLSVRDFLELKIEWPVPHLSGCALSVAIDARVVSCMGNMAEAKIIRYEFRTRRALAVAA